MNDTTAQYFEPFALKFDLKFPGRIGEREIIIVPSHARIFAEQVHGQTRQNMLQIFAGLFDCFFRFRREYSNAFHLMENGIMRGIDGIASEALTRGKEFHVAAFEQFVLVG